MQGRFDITKKNAGGLLDADFAKAQREGWLAELLDELPTVQKVQTNNRIFDNMAGFILDKLFSLSNCGNYYYETDDGGPSALYAIGLSTDGSATDNYQEDWSKHNSYNDNQNLSQFGTSVISSGATKRFAQDGVESWVVESAADREAITYKDKWLFTPQSFSSTSIKSIEIWFVSDGNTGLTDIDYGDAAGKIGRVRLKDSEGNDVTLTKNTSEIVLVEYTFTLVSM